MLPGMVLSRKQFIKRNQRKKGRKKIGKICRKRVKGKRIYEEKCMKERNKER